MAVGSLLRILVWRAAERLAWGELPKKREVCGPAKAAPSTWARGRKSSADVTREIVKSKGCFDILVVRVE
jgi:hypothetical protein